MRRSRASADRRPARGSAARRCAAAAAARETGSRPASGKIDEAGGGQAAGPSRTAAARACGAAPRPTGPRARPPRRSAAAWPWPRPRSIRGSARIMPSSVSAASSRWPAAKAAWAKASCASMSAGRSAAAARSACSSPSSTPLAASASALPACATSGSARSASGSASNAACASSLPARGDQRADQPRLHARRPRAPSRRSARRSHAARSPSPSASTCSPIAISGAISACLPGARRPAACSSSWSSICLQLRFGARRGQVGDRLALEHRIDRGDRAHLELRGDELLLVDIELGQHHALVGIFGGDLLEHRGQRLARPAPFGPEIEDHEAGPRGLDDILAEPVDRLLLVEVEAHACHVRAPSLSRCAPACAASNVALGEDL